MSFWVLLSGSEMPKGFLQSQRVTLEDVWANWIIKGQSPSMLVVIDRSLWTIDWLKELKAKSLQNKWKTNQLSDLFKLILSTQQSDINTSDGCLLTGQKHQICYHGGF